MIATTGCFGAMLNQGETVELSPAAKQMLGLHSRLASCKQT
ncbi:hypothetical protein [Sporomusa sphaeroides]|nr:hypothetical protein [Sporomusa sphaeroides]